MVIILRVLFISIVCLSFAVVAFTSPDSFNAALDLGVGSISLASAVAIGVMAFLTSPTQETKLSSGLNEQLYLNAKNRVRLEVQSALLLHMLVLIFAIFISFIFRWVFKEYCSDSICDSLPVKILGGLTGFIIMLAIVLTFRVPFIVMNFFQVFPRT